MYGIIDLKLRQIQNNTMKISAKLKFFLLNLVAAVIVVVVIGIIVLFKLDSYTHHGESIAVPQFYDMTPPEAETLAKHHNLRIKVVDSLYDDHAKPGAVVEQYPASGSRVKEKRLIQLTINAQSPEKIVFPNLKNSAFRQTLQTLESRGFKIGRIEYEESEFKNLVLNLKHNGKDVEPGTPLPKGTTIDIVLGNGYGSNTIIVPHLAGKKLREAISLAQQSYLNIGEIIPDVSVKTPADQQAAVVYQQSPNATGIAQAGSPVNLYITLLKSKIANIDSLIVTE